MLVDDVVAGCTVASFRSFAIAVQKEDAIELFKDGCVVQEGDVDLLGHEVEGVRIVLPVLASAEGLRKDIVSPVQASAEGLRKDIVSPVQASAEGLRKDIVSPVQASAVVLLKDVDIGDLAVPPVPASAIELFKEVAPKVPSSPKT